MDGKSLPAIPRFQKYQVANEHLKEVAFVLPSIPCGIYQYTPMFADGPTDLVFRYIPRARQHKGRFGVFADDPDAGPVLIGLYDPKTEQVERLGTLYPEYWEGWLGATLVTRRCAWCGREMPFYTHRMTHDSDRCDKETENF